MLQTPRAPIAIVGGPTALGGHFAGMERTPPALRRLGLLDALAAERSLPGVDLVDAGDARNDPGWAPDPDPHAKNRGAIVAFLGRLSAQVETAVTDAGPGARLLVLGGDCTAHAGAVAGLRRIRPRRGSASSGSMRTATSTPRPRPPPATSGGCHSPCSSDAASPTSLVPSMRLPSARRMPR